ncbi:hypothetical protein CH252_18925 [Rhodococcus sp. 06-1477-1B]|nr:hypothetical protein CH252_18925 [Rhodococcus sp. 06-1477-1B]
MSQHLGAQRVVEDLRVAILRQRLSLSAIAKRTGRSFSSVSRRFNNDVPVSLDDLFDFAGAAGMDVQVQITPTTVDDPDGEVTR